MKRFWPIALLTLGLALCAAPLCAQPFQLQGKVVNGTHGSEGNAELITLLSLSQGMQEIASLKDVKGSFQIPLTDAQSGPFLLRATYQGVNYFTTIGPEQARQKQVHEVTVYDPIASLEKAIVRLPHLFIKRVEDRLLFDWNFEVENPTKNTLNKLGGLFQVSIPQDAQSINVAASGGRMPLRASLTKDPDGSYRINYAIKPGKTTFEVSYDVDYSKQNYDLKIQSLYPLQKVMALIYPEDMQVASVGLKEIQVDAANHVKVTGWDSIEAGQTWHIALSGGSKIAQPQQSESAPESAAEPMHNHADSADHQVVEKPPALSKVAWVLFALMGLGLGLNVFLFLRNKAVAATPQFDFAQANAYREKLSQLKEARQSSALDEKTFRQRQQALMQEAWKAYLEQTRGD